MTLAQSECESHASALLDIVKREAPGAEIVVRARAEREANTRFAVNRITTNGDYEQIEMTAEVAFGRRHAAASVNQTDSASLGALARRVVEMAKLAPEDPERVPVLGPQTYDAVPSAYDDAAAELNAEARAHAAEIAITTARREKLTIAGFITGGYALHVMLTSAGLRASHRETSLSMSMTARTESGNGSGWAGRVSHRANDIDATDLARAACEKARASAGPEALAPGHYTVVLEPAAVSEMLAFLVDPLDARSVDEGRSVLARPGNRVGDAIASELVTIRSDPQDASTPSAPYDGDGLPLHRIAWIDKGHLMNLRYSRYWAAKQGKTPTGYQSAFTLAGGNAERIEDLVSGVERGLLITRFWYTRHLDPKALIITGLTRDGVLLIEKGKVTRPVNNFRFNESPLTVLKNCEALTSKTWRSPTSPRWSVPALRTSGFHCASISDAV